MKNKQAIYLLFLSNIISGFAQGISMIAIPWYFVEIVNRPSVFSVSYIIITFLILFWGLYAGTLIDRYSRKRIFIITNLICGTIIGFIALSGFYTSEVKDFLVVFVFGLTIFNYNVHYPNLYAFGQEITEKKYYGKLNSYIEIQGQTTSVLAGAFAALLLTGTKNQMINLIGFNITLPFDIEAWDIHEIFLMDAITYFIGILIIIFIKYNPVKKKYIQTGTVWRRFKGGIEYLSNNKLIFIFGLASYMLFAFLLVELHVLLPSYVRNFLEEGGEIYAAAEVYYSFGAIIAGVFIIRLFRKYNTVLGVISLMIFSACAFLAMAFYKSVVIFFIANLILGVTNAGVRVLRTTYIFNHVPNHVIGRTNSVFNSLNIIVRMFLIGLFTFPFFTIGDNIKLGYLVGVGLIIIALFPIIINYKKTVYLDKIT
ncbi:MAG: MFS transporter [Bacteroidota bacterium]|nr:MFS transporter [Bacteroidota bacterium]